MKYNNIIGLLIVTTTLLTACNSDDDANGATDAELTPINVTATLPAATGNGVVSRGFTDANTALSLFYTNQKGDFTMYQVADDDIKQANGSNDFSFSTTKGDKNIKPLYWQQVDGKGLKPQTFYAYLSKDETVKNTTYKYDNALWAKKEYNPIDGMTNATVRPILEFGNLKGRYSQIVININVPNIDNLALDKLSVGLYAKGYDADNAYKADGMKYQAAPTISADANMISLKKAGTVVTDATTQQYIAFIKIAPQVLPTTDGNLYIAYNANTFSDDAKSSTATTVDPAKPSYVWKLDLSKVNVTRKTTDNEFATKPQDMAAYGTHGPGFAFGTAFGYNAGERITITVNLSLKALTPGAVGNFNITDYTVVVNDAGYSFDAKPTNP